MIKTKVVKLENNKVLVFIGAFLFGMSIVLIILSMFFVKQFDANAEQNTYFETFLGWLGATIIGGGLALKNYMNSSQGMGYGMGGEEVGDSTVSFVTGLSFALYALLATWLYIINVNMASLVICLISSACSFIGLIMVSYFSMQSD